MFCFFRMTSRLVWRLSWSLFGEILKILVKDLSREAADRGVLVIGKIGERNARGCIDDLETIAGQQHDTGFPRQAEEEFNAKIALDEPGLEFRPVEFSAHLLQVDERVVIDIVWFANHRHAHGSVQSLITLPDQLLRRVLITMLAIHQPVQREQRHLQLLRSRKASGMIKRDRAA